MIKHIFNDKNKKYNSSELPEYAVLPRATHESYVLVITSAEQAKNISPRTHIADAIVTNVKNIECFITGADCPPIVFKDEQNNIAAIAHCGWKPALAGIIENTIAELSKLGAKNIAAYMGPGIDVKNFECRDDVYEKFTAKNESYSQFFTKKSDEHWLLDLKSFCKAILMQNGITNIEDVDIDTYADSNYHSYRQYTHIHGKDFLPIFKKDKDNYLNFNSVIITD